MMIELAKGGNTTLRVGQEPAGRKVLVGVSWTNTDADVDLCALLCDDKRQVLDDRHFLFWSNEVSPGNEAFLRSCPPGQASPSLDRGQLILDLEDMPSAVARVFVSLSIMVDGADLNRAGGIDVRLLDLTTGQETARFRSAGYGAETCAVLAEIYRHRGGWRMRNISQGYEGGLADLGRDYGVNIE